MSVFSAAPAEFKSKDAAKSPSTHDHGDTASSQPEPERLFVLEGETHEGAFAGQDGGEEKQATDTGAQRTPGGPSEATSESSRLDLPSKSIILKHAWNPLEPQDSTEFFDELEQDMRSECTKFGAVDHVRDARRKLLCHGACS